MSDWRLERMFYRNSCITAMSLFFCCFWPMSSPWNRNGELFIKEGSGLTVASLTAFSGMVMRGKEYIAPCTGLQLMPWTVLRTCSVSLAFSAKALNVAVRSWMWERDMGKGYFSKGFLSYPSLNDSEVHLVSLLLRFTSHMTRSKQHGQDNAELKSFWF